LRLLLLRLSDIETESPTSISVYERKGSAVSHSGMKLEALVEEEGEEPPTFAHDGKGGGLAFVHV
jgi:hypothetical protein